MASCLQRILRKKSAEDTSLDTPLRRCYNTFDLTLIGIGSMVGSGIYVIIGHASKDVAGTNFVQYISTLLGENHQKVVKHLN